jgi:type IV fimbrial biogenesis protein FimT
VSKLSIKKFQNKKLIKGFTIIELLISITIIGILTAIASPGLGQFIVKLRVDNEISEIHRLVLTARNSAINSGENVTLCPLNGITCSDNWQNELSVFLNSESTLVNNNTYDSVNEEWVKVKAKIASGDTLIFSQGLIIFAPTGRLVSGGNSNFSYCPKGNSNLSRGIEISLSGQVYTTADTDNDGKDENRNGTEVSCS